MLAPNWLQVVVAIVALNTVLVATSLIHRHVVADKTTASENITNGVHPESDTTVVEPSSPEIEPELTLQEKLQRLVPPVLEDISKPIADDDPLMAEIRKQAAVQFPESQISPAIETKSKPEPTYADNTTGLQSRLAAISQLSNSAQSLVALSNKLRAAGNAAEADALANQAQQLQATMRELLE